MGSPNSLLVWREFANSQFIHWLFIPLRSLAPFSVELSSVHHFCPGRIRAFPHYHYFYSLNSKNNQNLIIFFAISFGTQGICWDQMSPSVCLQLDRSAKPHLIIILTLMSYHGPGKTKMFPFHAQKIVNHYNVTRIWVHEEWWFVKRKRNIQAILSPIATENEMKWYHLEF